MRQKQIQNKKLEIRLISSELALYCRSLGVVCIPSETPLEKTNFSFASQCQLLLGWSRSPGLLLPVCAGTHSILNLCRPCFCCCRFHRCNSPVGPGGHCFPVVIHPPPPPSYKLLTPFLHSFLNPKGRIWMKMSHLR